MGRNNYFQFKQFKIIQEHAAMKVGTDGVLLGAWANSDNVTQILDVGTGTGLIALMMAQRTNASVTGIEIEKKAAVEATDNILNSPWSQRIKIINESLQNFQPPGDTRYDLIISNPPFFTKSKRSKVERLAIAKHNDLLPFNDLIKYSANLMTENGKIALIIPFLSYDEVIEYSQNANLHVIRKTLVKPYPSKNPHRVLLELGKPNTSKPEMDTININDENRQNFSEKFKTLISPFYLNY